MFILLALCNILINVCFHINMYIEINVLYNLNIYMYVIDMICVSYLKLYSHI